MIYFLFGTDDYRIKEKSDEIKNFYQKKYPNLLGFDTYDFEEKNNFDEFKNFFESISMFAPQKLAIAYNPFNSSEFKKIADFLTHANLKNNKENNLVIVQTDFDKEKIKKLSKEKGEFFHFLKKQAKTQEFQPFKNFSEALPWIKIQLKKYDIKIDLPALKILFENFKNNSYQFINELIKASLFNPKEKITLKELESISSFEINPDFFAIFDNFFDGNKKLMLFNLEKALKGGVDEGQIFNYFIKQIRVAIYILNNQTNNIEAPDFVVNKIKKKMMRWKNSKEILLKIYEQLAKIDWLIKKGALDYQTALEILIAHLK